MDTRPYRLVISPSAVAAMDAAATPSPENAPATAAAGGASTATAAPAAASPSRTWRGLAVAWFVVLVSYLPLNLAWLCAAASTLGTLGSRVNLSDDAEADASRDNTNPYVSALLRGFFVYLFMTSGLLLLDETPFSSPSPGQYIRLAGFLSLFSFVISYQPRLFTALVVSAFQRIHVRDRANESTTTESAVVVHKQTEKETETVEKVVVSQTDKSEKAGKIDED